VISGGGWPVPYAWIQGIPAWLRTPLGGQAGWKWIALALVLVLFGPLLLPAYRLSRRGSSEHPVLRSMAQVALPAFFLLAAPVVALSALAQINLMGSVANAVELAATAVMYIAGAWLSWRLAPVVAEAIIALPRIAPESIDAHLIRICTRLPGMFAGAGLLAFGADRVGIPVYGIIAGLGVGGLAIALAAQPTVENLIGGLSLFADKPIRVGDLCRYGNDEGTVEAIGIRSTRIRGIDRALTTIPNATLSKMPVVNLAQRDRMLIRTVIGVRCETSPEQLRFLLVKIREIRDDGLNTERTEAAESQVRQWRDEGRLPFPNFSTEQIRQMRGTLPYPLPGSPDTSNAGPKTDTEEG
jgi:MscS family membrane protein